MSLAGIETRGRDSKFSQEDLLVIFHLIAKDPTLYYHEIRDELEEITGTSVDQSMIQKNLKALESSKDQNI